MSTNHSSTPNPFLPDDFKTFEARVKEAGLSEDPDLLDDLARSLSLTSQTSNMIKAERERLENLWLELYFRDGAPKTWTREDGLKIVCRDAGAPKEKITPGHWGAGDVEELIQKYGVEVLVSQGFIKWVPEQKEMSKGSRAGISVTLPKEMK